jgi:hypothetical protein
LILACNPEGFAGFFMDFFLLFKNAFCYTNGRA